MLGSGGDRGVDTRIPCTMRLIGTDSGLGNMQYGDAQIGIIGQATLYQAIQLRIAELGPPGHLVVVRIGVEVIGRGCGCLVG